MTEEEETADIAAGSLSVVERLRPIVHRLNELAELKRPLEKLMEPLQREMNDIIAHYGPQVVDDQPIEWHEAIIEDYYDTEAVNAALRSALSTRTKRSAYAKRGTKPKKETKA